MSWRAMWCAVAAIVAGWEVASAQVVDSAAAAVGIYRAIVPSDTRETAGGTAEGFSPLRYASRASLKARPARRRCDRPLRGYPGADGFAWVTRSGFTARRGRFAGASRLQRLPDTSRKQNALQPVDEPRRGDTSLTARMDARRGGGLAARRFPDLLSTAAMTGELPDVSQAGGSIHAPPHAGRQPPRHPARPDRQRVRQASRGGPRPAATDAQLRDAWLGTLVLNGSLKSRDLVKAGSCGREAGPSSGSRRATAWCAPGRPAWCNRTSWPGTASCRGWTG